MMVPRARPRRARKIGRKRPTRGKYWSGRVTKESNALDIKADAFTSGDPKKIARTLKQSAERSKRRKAGTYQSAMSMLNFYINRAGRNLTRKRKEILSQAKVELRRIFHRS